MSAFHAAMKRREWALARKTRFGLDGFRCTACGKASRLEAHHIVPLQFGGSAYAQTNLQTLCKKCHIDKHQRTVNTAWAALVNEVKKSD